MFPKPKPVDQRSLFLEGATHISLIQAVEAFLRLEMPGKSPATHLWYSKRLFPWACALGEERLLADLLEGELHEYAACLAGRRFSTYTLHGHIRALKRFFRWLFKKGILPVDLAADLALPRLPRQGRKGIQEANLTAILAAAQDSPRDYALLKFLESTGVRRGGAAHLCFDDLNLDAVDERLRRRASVREKGEKERTVIMSRDCLAALLAWVAVRPDPQLDQDYVFIGQSPGQPWHRLSEDAISGVVERYKKRLGLRGACSPHQWRHRWARHRLHQGMEISQVSQLLGHEDISVTVRFYGQFDIDQLQESYDRYPE